jgi:hypothetical protein
VCMGSGTGFFIAVIVLTCSLPGCRGLASGWISTGSKSVLDNQMVKFEQNA